MVAYVVFGYAHGVVPQTATSYDETVDFVIVRRDLFYSQYLDQLREEAADAGLTPPLALPLGLAPP